MRMTEDELKKYTPIIYKGNYYFPDYNDAREFAINNSLPADRIIPYDKGWAIQREKSGLYYGPNGWS